MDGTSRLDRTYHEVVRGFGISVFIGVALSCAPRREFGSFYPYIDEFETEGRRFGRVRRIDDLVIEVGEDLEPGSIAQCITAPFSTPTIRIRSDWNLNSPVQQKLVLFHELGHCVLGRPHRDDLLPDGLPASMMNAHNVGARIYAHDPDYYLCELFGGTGCLTLRTNNVLPTVAQDETGVQNSTPAVANCIRHTKKDPPSPWLDRVQWTSRFRTIFQPSSSDR